MGDIEAEFACQRYVTLTSPFHMTLTFNHDLQFFRLLQHTEDKAGQCNTWY